MEIHQGPIIVTIHCIRTGANNDYAVFVGRNPFGPRGGRAGNVMDGECLLRNACFVEAINAADEFVASHPLALLVITESQQEGAERVRRGELTCRCHDD